MYIYNIYIYIYIYTYIYTYIYIPELRLVTRRHTQDQGDDAAGSSIDVIPFCADECIEVQVPASCIGAVIGKVRMYTYT